MFPSFLQPGFFWIGFASLAIPIAIHLLFRQRSRQVSLGTLRFLKVVLHENARRRRLKQWLLLGLRILAIMLLASLFARPFYAALASGRSKERFIAVLIDRSASMNLADRGTSLLDHAVGEARSFATLNSSGTEVQFAFFDHSIRPFVDDKGKSTGLTLEVPPDARGATSYGNALTWARDACVKAPHARKEVHLFTDLQQSGLDWTGAESLPADVAFHLHDVGRQVNNNVAVIGIVTAKTVVRPGEPVHVEASILNGGPFPLEKRPVVLTLKGNGQRQTFRETITLEAGASGNVEFEVSSLSAGLWQGTVKIEVDDELAFDNERYLALLSQQPMPVVIVDGDPRPSALFSETYYLEAALRLAPPGQFSEATPFTPTVVPLSNTEVLPDLKNVRVVVLANVARLPASDVQKLQEFVKEGGGLAVFAGDQTKEELFDTLHAARLAPGTYLGQAQASDLPWRLQTWKESHSLFAAFNDPQLGDIRRLAFRAYVRTEPGPESTVLAKFQNDEPAVVEVKPEGKGRVLWIMTSADRDWSDWPRSRLYVPVIYQTLGYLTGLTEGGPIRETLLDAAYVGPQVVPGVHKQDGYWSVVNTSPRESEMERSTSEDFAHRFGLTLEQSGARDKSVPKAAAAAAVQMDLRDDEVWPWVIVVVLAVMLGEVFLANRTMV